MIPIILLKAFEIYEAKNQTDLVPRRGPGVAVIGGGAFGGPEKSSHFKTPPLWASVCESAMPGREGIGALVKETQRSGSPVSLSQPPQPPQGLALRGWSFWVWGAGRGSWMSCLPLRPTVFPNPRPGPPGPGEVVRGAVLL